MADSRTSRRYSSDENMDATIRRLWQSFTSNWLPAEKSRTDARAHEIVKILNGLDSRHQAAYGGQEVETILRRRYVWVSRKSWLSQVRQQRLPLRMWAMTDHEEESVKRELGWGRDEMLQAERNFRGNEEYHDEALDALLEQERRIKAGEVARFGPVYHNSTAQSAGLTPSVQQEPKWQASGFGHNRTQSTPNPTLLTETPRSRHHESSWNRPSPRHSQPTSRYSGPYHIPLHWAAPEYGDPDYEVLSALGGPGMTTFAMNVCESKIREFYAEACETTVMFNRHLAASSSRSKAQKLQDEFARRMKLLADVKRKEWKHLIGAEVARLDRDMEGSTDVEMEEPQARNASVPSPRPRKREIISRSLSRRGAETNRKQMYRATRAWDEHSIGEKRNRSRSRSKNFVGRFVRRIAFADSSGDSSEGTVTPIRFA